MSLFRRLAICLAFATWCFADTWVEFADGTVPYFVRYDPFLTVVVPILWLELIVTLGMFASWEFCRRTRLNKVTALHFLLLGTCLAPVGMAAVALLRLAPAGWSAPVRAPWFWPVAFLVGALPLFWVLRQPVRVSRLMRSVLLYSWPVLLLMLVQGVRGSLLFPHSAYAEGALARPVRSSPGRVRVIWIIFDELSQTIAFDNRAGDLALPNLDRLKQESFYATAAESPALQTSISLPSLILGEQVAAATPDRPDDLRVRLQSHAGVSWSSLPNAFDDARDLGFNTALVGWYHPYGRVLNRSLTKCYWTAGWLPPGIAEPAESRPLLLRMEDRVVLQFVAMPLIGHLAGAFVQRYDRRDKLTRFDFLSDRACEIVSDPGVGLALIHLPVPHPPVIFDRAKGAFRSEKTGSYLDNVALADRELGVLRRAIEDAGLWDSTAILVSADHGWRTGLWRGSAWWSEEDEASSHQDTTGVPFLLKLPNAGAVVYGKRFNTVVTRRLITGILKGQITGSAAVTAVIEGGGSH